MLRVLTLVAVLVAAGCSSGDPEAASTRLTEVIDGDTVRLVISGVDERVRLIGFNAPESFECHGPEATEALRSLLGGKDLRVEAAGDSERDRFGRLLSYLYADDTLVNLAMVEQGHGVAMATGHRLLDEFLAADARAWDTRSGMWGDAACGSITNPQITIESVVANPPGDDAERPNEETVVVRNGGPSSADLSDWQIRDESSTHRYVVPAATEVPAGGTVTLHSGCGTNTAADLYWCAGPVWSNRGDTAILQMPGGTVVDRLRYRGR